MIVIITATSKFARNRKMRIKFGGIPINAKAISYVAALIAHGKKGSK